MTSQSPDVSCVMELQARYTQYRHTIFLTGNPEPNTSHSPRPAAVKHFILVPAEHSFEKFPVYSSRGVVMAGIEEIRRDFARLVGHRDTANMPPDTAEILASKGQFKRSVQREVYTQPGGSVLTARFNHYPASHIVGVIVEP